MASPELIAVAIGAELGVDARRQEGPRVVGYLHEVGKIAIPTEILAKPGKLSPILAGSAEDHSQACRQCAEVLVYRPEQRVRSEQNGGEQRHIYGAATRVTELLPLDQGECLIGSGDDGLPQILEIAECARAGFRRRSARDFEDDKRMAQYLVHRKQRLKHGTGTAEMRNPDRGIRKDQTHRGRTSAGRRREMSFIPRALPPKAASRLPACTRTNTFIASRNRSPLSISGSATSSAL